MQVCIHSHELTHKHKTAHTDVRPLNGLHYRVMSWLLSYPLLADLQGQHREIHRDICCTLLFIITVQTTIPGPRHIHTHTHTHTHTHGRGHIHTHRLTCKFNIWTDSVNRNQIVHKHTCTHTHTHFLTHTHTYTQTHTSKRHTYAHTHVLRCRQIHANTLL